MFATNLTENSNGKRKHMRLLAILLLTVVTVFFTMGEAALAKKKKKNKNRFCTQTAKVAYKACLFEIGDDYNIAVANCINVSDDGDRAECFNDAKNGEEGYRAAREECKDQFEARRDLCEDLGEARYDPDIGSLTFVDPADIGDSEPANPYFPLVPGNKWTYKASEDGFVTVTETIVVEVLAQADAAIRIEGVDCVVVRDIVYEGDSTDDDDILEDTYDWYGQKIDGTVVYMGEWSLSKEDCETDEDPEGDLCEGLFSEDGSWKHGFEGGKAGIIMFPDPAAEVGTVFRQEVSYGNAEDAAEVLSFGVESVSVTAGNFTADVLKTLDFTPIEPDGTEFKWYAPDVGVIKEQAFEDGMPTGEVVELESFTPGS